MFFLCVPARAFSWNLGIGPSLYYSVWTPEFIGQHENAQADPALLAGGIVSFQFYERYILSAQTMFSVTSQEAEYTVDVPSAAKITLNTGYKREENEISFMYVLNARFRISLGYKMMNFDEIELIGSHTVPSYPVQIGKFSNQFHILGPGLGISYGMPLPGNFSASLGTSILYFWMTYYGYFPHDSGTAIEAENVTYEYNGIGNNTSLVFSYFFSSISTSINFGGRCQVIRYLDSGSAPELGYDLNYGLTLSALYIW